MMFTILVLKLIKINLLYAISKYKQFVFTTVYILNLVLNSLRYDKYNLKYIYQGVLQHTISKLSFGTDSNSSYRLYFESWLAG